MLPLGTYKDGCTFACNEYSERWFNAIVDNFFTEKKKWVAPVLPPTKPDPFANFFDELIKDE